MRWQKPEGGNDPGVSLRVLVTGSRGKSSVVRLLHAAMRGAGLRSYARITGVVPRELGPDGIRPISRSAGAHVGEMHWWLRRLPTSAGGIVLENSAISPDLQHLASRWLQPDVTVLTNTLPDHQEAWGPSRANAADALALGIPRNGHVILPSELENDPHLQNLLARRGCRLRFAKPVTGTYSNHRAANLGLALAAIKHLGLAEKPAMQSMLDLPRDDYDFQVIDYAGAELAMAFSVNDISSTRTLFRSLEWSKAETHLLYNHRADRPARLKSFIGWLNSSAWRDVWIIGDRPRMRTGRAGFLRLNNNTELSELLQPGTRVFGCGNISGLPMTLVAGQPAHVTRF